MIHSLHSWKEAGMLMQLDISKAYDKVSWSYLEAVLEAFGFSKQWIKWVLALIKSPRYSILVNGAPSAPFSPSRGIRKGDPLSPFLFVILMEGLSRLIAKKKKKVKLEAIQSHLSRLLGFKIGSLPSRYLGAPLTLKQWQKVHWEKFLASMERKCKHWTNRALNFAGRLILIKAVLQAIPQYMLSIFLAPKGILDQMRSIQRSFLWSGNNEKKKWSLVAWKKLCKRKDRGGLNLVDPSMVNRICGAKIWWKWILDMTLPWATLWKEKYRPNSSNLELIRMQETPNGSPIWNHAQANRSIVQDYSFWEIRNGT
eukprot:PITA_20018